MLYMEDIITVCGYENGSINVYIMLINLGLTIMINSKLQWYSHKPQANIKLLQCVK